MTPEEKLSFFHSLINCNYKVYLWTYATDMTLIHTDCPPDLITGDMVSLLNFRDILHSHLKNGGHYPLILEISFGLLWIAAFEYRDLQPYRIHMIGPVFTGRNSHLIIKKKLDQYNLSVKLRSQVFHQIENVPIIPSTTLIQYGVMLHYAVTGEQIAAYHVQFPENAPREASDDLRLISEEHRGIWMTEQTLMNLIREGNPDYQDALEKSMSLSYGVKFDVGDSLRQQKNSVLTLLTLCSRACIEGGLNPSISYTLCDYYNQRIEDSHTTTELSGICRTMLDDYVQRVRSARENNAVSRQIRSSCEYISSHIKEKLSISALAKQAGYTEYYFSHKFKEETGLSVTDYIRREKLEHAKLLLSASKMSIQQISEELSFGSRSYFSSSFQKETGISPSEFREQNLKL